MPVSLSTELVHELSGIHLSAKPETHSAKRTAQRIPFQQRAKVFPLVGPNVEEAEAIEVRDLSTLGVGFRVKRKFACDDRLVLCLSNTSGDSVVLLCSIRRCAPVSGSSAFVVGATFEQILSAPTETTAKRIRKAILGDDKA